MITTVAGVVPAFLTGALGVQMADGLGFEAAGLGAAVATFFGGAAVSSALMGRLVERIGPARALRLGSLASGALMGVLATAVHGYGPLLAVLGAAGVVNAMIQPATNLLLARRVPSHRQGIAFAIKQSGMPLGTLVGGAAVPLVALTVGWRWAFAGGAALAAVAAATVPRPAPRTGASAGRDHPTGRPRPFGPLAVLAIAVGLGAAAASGVVAFLVSGAVDAGLSPGTAGWTLTLGSAIGIAMRLVQGRLADRRGARHLPVVASLLLGGAAAYGLLAIGAPWLYLAATPLAFGAGWAWPGLFNLAVVRSYADAPGAATGVTQTGTYLGAVLGPLVFGVVVDAASYRAAWLLTALWTALAALMMVVARRRVLASRDRSPSSPWRGATPATPGAT